MSVMLNRVMGAATAVYSLAIIVRPQWLAKPCGLTDGNGEVQPSTALLIRAIGARDAAIGTAMLLARDPNSRRLATACRVAADACDVVVFGTSLREKDKRLKVAGFGAVWAALCAASLHGADPAVSGSRGRTRRSA